MFSHYCRRLTVCCCCCCCLCRRRRSSMLYLLVTAECCVALQVIDQKPQYLEMAGNLIPIAKTEEQLNIVFRAFHENRMAFPVRIRDPTREPTARLTFMREPREARGQTPVCSVVVTLPEFSPADSTTDVDQTKTCESLSPFSLSLPLLFCCLLAWFVTR